MNSNVRPNFKAKFTKFCTYRFRKQCTGTRKKRQMQTSLFLVQSKQSCSLIWPFDLNNWEALHGWSIPNRMPISHTQIFGPDAVVDRVRRWNYENRKPCQLSKFSRDWKIYFLFFIFYFLLSVTMKQCVLFGDCQVLSTWTFVYATGIHVNVAPSCNTRSTKAF